MNDLPIKKWSLRYHLKKRSAQQIIAALAGKQDNPRCRALRAPRKRRAALCASHPQRFVPSTVAEALCAFNIFTEKKHREEPDYMHNNSVKRRLVTFPDQWL
jgi:hypothetical protein